MKLKALTRELFRQAGCDVGRYRPLAIDPFAAQEFLMRDSNCRVVFDVGAFQGDATARYARAFRQAEIYAFEPFPPSYKLLAERYAHEARVHVVNAAVSSETGSALFHVNGIAATNSLLSRPSTGRRYYPRAGDGIETITVSTVGLDEFCRQHQVNPPAVLKLDIQGNELAALRGAEQMLRNEDVSLIFTEVAFVPLYEGGVQFNEICSHLNERGYSLFNIYDMCRTQTGQIRFADALFVSDSYRRSVIDALPEEF